ncbi:MAG: hypothetical protein ABIK62_06785, partial [candidate division WOR-3 bacterium]
MKNTLIALALGFLVMRPSYGEQGPDWGKLGFKAEPGVAVGTPCVLNLMARFWYRNFGISTCGLYLPSGVNFLSGQGFESNLLYKLVAGRRQLIEPYVAVGGGATNISTSVAGTSGINIYAPLYAGLQVGAYYRGAFVQVGIGVGRFRVTG